MRLKNGEIKEKWITIRYDYVPKYYKTCKLERHDEKQCFVIHPELYPQEEEEVEYKADNKEEVKVNGKTVDRQQRQKREE